MDNKSPNSADPLFSKEYLEWVNQSDLPPLTNTQHRFAEWLFLEDNAKAINKIGNLDAIFVSVRRFIKNKAINN